MTSSTYTGEPASSESGSRKIEEEARQHPSLVALARLGWVSKGIVYGLIGVLAVPIALQDSGADKAGAKGEASQLGAVAEISDSSLGVFVLWVVAIGLALYVLWRLVSVALPAENSAKAWVTRIGYLISAVVYTSLIVSAISFAQHDKAEGGRQTEDAKVERFTRDLMDHTGGRWLVGAIGVAIVIAGIYFIVAKGFMGKFRDELEPGGVGPIQHEWIVTLGRIGWVGRGIVTGLVGWFLAQAAVQYKPSEAKGFDGSLREVTDSGLGTALVLFAAIALIVYGAFCIISAPRQRLTGAD